ncbi:MAG: molybdopterin-dependent oxidoreductase [Leptolyngbyaceae cyanobacterium RU_5_1]|nr:molybdopterin-dependent oxidoreductase [Leptolyngbyaceae cyanobacterium RU_5_1]
MASCDRAPESPFLPNLLTPTQPLPDHLITPLSEFYVQSYGLPVSITAEQWQLEITGAIATPLKLSYSDILAAPQDDFYLTMECIGNPAGGNQIGNALWTGTSLLPFLQKAGIRPDAVEFVLHGADFYETTLPIKDVMRSDVRLVHQMNHAPLTKEHGYPVRIIIPGHYGQKQPKWLVTIEAIAQSKQGYWERQGWSNIARISTHALVRQVQNTRVWNRHNHVALPRNGDQGWTNGIWVAGVAIDQSSSIQRILVSTDAGKTWQPAEQNHPASPHEWTVWRYPWRPNQPGQYTLLARAESQRETQALDDKDSMDGSSGVLRVQIELEA